MKINVVPTVISVALSSLMAYALYEISSGDKYNLLLTIVGGIYLLLTLWGTMGYSIERGRRAANMKVLSGVFFFIGIIMEFVFAMIGFSLPLFIILHGGLLLVLILMLYSLNKAQ